MNVEIYRIIHLIGLVMLLLGLGGIVLLREELKKGIKTGTAKCLGAFHGIGLLLMLLGGFGMIAKLKYAFPGWIIAKLVIWLILGGWAAVGKKSNMPAPLYWLVILLLCTTAFYLVSFKPF